MTRRHSASLLLLLLCLIPLLLSQDSVSASQEYTGQVWIFGSLQDTQNQPVAGATISLHNSPSEQPISKAETQSNGRFSLLVPDQLTDQSVLFIERPHFQTTAIDLTPESIQELLEGSSIALPVITLDREITSAFWFAGAAFLLVLVLIATGYLHNTLAAFAGASAVLAISYLGTPLTENLFIFNFQGAISYIDWNVIFLIMGMMIVIAVVEETGIFHWLAYFAYRISGGRMWILLPVLMLITGIASAFLDNVTTMLLMTPITVQIALALNITPLALLMPEVFASNVIGVSTLIGTPTNILIGSFGEITFNNFLANLTPGVFLAFIGLIAYCWFIFREELAEAKTSSALLLETLEQRGKITNIENLKKSGWIGAGMLVLFIFGESIHLLPSVTALIGASALLVWIRPNVDDMIDAVDWTTLVFFMSLFIVVGSIQEVGLISIIADFIGNQIGNNLILAMAVVTWFSALLSMVIANIPFTAAMLPVIAYLTQLIPGAENKVLYYCLSIGAAMGGNGSLIGASANMITAGIAERAGYKISYRYFLKKGFPALLVTISLALIWLYIRF